MYSISLPMLYQTRCFVIQIIYHVFVFLGCALEMIRYDGSEEVNIITLLNPPTETTIHLPKRSV